MSCAWKSDVRLCIVLVMTTFTKMEDTINVTVGENVKLECPFIFGFLFTGPMVEEEIRWTGGHDGPILGICNKYRNEWEDYWSNDGFKLEHADGCDKNVVSIEARKPGHFSYVCSLWRVGSEVDRLVNNMTFSLRVSCSDESLLECKLRYLPSKFLQWSQLVEINCEDLCGVGDSSDGIETMRFEMNNKILHPDAVFSNHITLRENTSFTRETSSQVYCVSHNMSAACEFEKASRNATIGIKPLVNRIFEGESPTFECIFEGIGRNPEYEWWISRYDQLSRISWSMNPILNISNVSLADDGIAVRCTCIVSGEILTAWAILDVFVAQKSTQTDVHTSRSLTSTPPPTSSEYRNTYTYISNTVTSSSIHVMSLAKKHSHSHYIAVIIILSILLAAATVIIGIFIMRNKISLTSSTEAKRQGPGIYMTTITGDARRTNSPTSSMPSQDDQRTYETIDSALPTDLRKPSSNTQEPTSSSSSFPRGVSPETMQDTMLTSSNQDSTDCDQNPVDQCCDDRSGVETVPYYITIIG